VGANFAPGSFLILGECLTAAGIGECPYGGSLLTADSTGAFSAPFTARRGVQSASGVVDCADEVELCSIVAFSYSGGDRASTPIDFDPSVPIPTPVVTVTPQFGVADRAVVHVHASKLTPGDPILVSQCRDDAPEGSYGCGYKVPPAIVFADANGEIDTSLRVFRDLTPAQFGLLVTAAAIGSCADAIGACVIRVQSLDDVLVNAEVPLGFDPTAVASPPVITVTPSGPYGDGQAVEVHGSGFTPSAILGMAQCQPDAEGCDNDSLYTEFRADDDGAFTRTITMHEQFVGNGQLPVD
jgi:hypothetical protein